MKSYYLFCYKLLMGFVVCQNWITFAWFTFLQFSILTRILTSSNCSYIVYCLNSKQTWHYVVNLDMNCSTCDVKQFQLKNKFWCLLQVTKLLYLTKPSNFFQQFHVEAISSTFQVLPEASTTFPAPSSSRQTRNPFSTFSFKKWNLSKNLQLTSPPNLPLSNPISK